MITLISFRAFINFPNLFYQWILNRFYRYFTYLSELFWISSFFQPLLPDGDLSAVALQSCCHILVNSPCLKINKSMARLDVHTVVHKGISRTSHFQLDISMPLIKLLVAGKVNNLSTKKLREDRLRWANWYDFF